MVFELHNDRTAEAEFLFNQSVYLQQSGRKVYTAWTGSVVSPDICCQLTETEPGHYVSGYRATFGGFEGSNINALNGFISSLLKELKERNASSLLIRQPPFFYNPSFYAACHVLLLKHGFTLDVSDVNQHVVVDPTVSFSECIDVQEKRRLRKLTEAGAECRILTQPGKSWYELLIKARASKGFPVTISEKDYLNLSSMLTDTYVYAGVFLNSILIANAVFVKISSASLYYFLPASDPEYSQYSPAVMILQTMYEEAVKGNYNTLDLGISSVDGIMNEGLHRFKKHIGAQDSAKNSYRFTF